MRTPFKILTFVLLTVCLNMLGVTAYGQDRGKKCWPLTRAELDTKLKQRAKPQKIIFFASWCSSCKDHLLKSMPDDLLLTAFDDPTRAATALSSLGLSRTCYDGDVAVQALSVKSLPATFTCGETLASCR